MGNREETLRTIINLSILLVVIATLGLSIAILVTVLNGNDNKKEDAYCETSKLINVKEPTEIGTQMPNYIEYKTVSQLLKQNLNTTVDPCDDLYKYTCGNFQDYMSFDISDLNNHISMVKQLSNKEYINNSVKPVQQIGWYFEKCIAARMSWNKTIESGSQVMDAINRLAAGNLQSNTSTQFPFTMLYQNKHVTKFPDPVGLGFLIGKLIGSEGISNMVSAYTDTNWKDPHGPHGYALLLDQPTTIYPYSYHHKAEQSTRDTIMHEIQSNMRKLAKSQNITLDETQLLKDARNIALFDYHLASTFSTDDTTRRKYERSYNLMTINTLKAKYDIIDWPIFIEEALKEANDQVKQIVNNDKFNFIVMEPSVFEKFNQLFTNATEYGLTPQSLVNYFYYRIVNAYEDFLPPIEAKPTTDFKKLKLVRPTLGRPRYIKAEKQKFRRSQEDNENIAAISCAAETVELLQYVNARIFIDYIYPTPKSRDDVKLNVGKVIESIIIGFRSMIDQLSWMSRSTKRGAYDKIDNLVKNIAYPEWITEDDKFTDYHEHLTFTNNDDYFQMVRNVGLFNIFTSWKTLAEGAVNREDFNGAPGTTNAWYQPQFNSITFPAAILQPPFYDPSQPTAINFGAMGIIAGHELTHGFDDEGVQWDGTGVLNGWMDDKSANFFQSMATCIVNEYNNFCPLNITEYGPAACIDGAQTQGENIADNGGIHAAYRAYSNFINLNGMDPQLPDPVMKEFTSQQLFFLSFARVWCQATPDNDDIHNQLLLDPHSPSQYRVSGTIQNFLAFKNAFNCPSYDSKKKCDVWVSDIVPATSGIPEVKTDLNILSNQQISTEDVKKYNSYKEAVEFYQASVDLSADPCNDFYKYSCGNYHNSGSFNYTNFQNLGKIVDQLVNPAYQEIIKKTPALLKEKQFFDACIQASSGDNGENILKSKNYLKTKVNKLASILGSNFTYVFGGTNKLPTADQLAEALGWLSFQEGIDTLITPTVDTNWKSPKDGYYIFLDQNTAYKSKTYYEDKAFKEIRNGYIQTISYIMSNFTTEEKLMTTPTKEEIGKLVDFEQVIAQKYSAPESERRKYERSWNIMNLKQLEANYPFIKWSTYIKQIPSVSGVTEESFTASVKEDAMLKLMNKDYAKADPKTFVNYLFMRLLLGNTKFMPIYRYAFENMPEESFFLGRRRYPSSYRLKSFTSTDPINCAGTANNVMQYATGRVFIDAIYPTKEDRIAIRKETEEVINNVITAFQGMINELNWMSTTTKKNAFKKTIDIKQNIAYPDWITNDDQLKEYYSDLVFSETDNYYDMLQKLTQFNIKLEYKKLTVKPADRYDFLGQPGVVNAWYQPELNSITFPAGILQPPYYHPKWPVSINYGGLGVVAGHELTHGFDDEGVQWDGEGVLNGWMDNNSLVGFDNMAKCVIKEYGKNFCPFTSKQHTPNCVNGDQTQGENIADNGGIHAAFRAYRVKIAENGPDPLLPDRLFGQFTHDQLFFLNFAQVWCEQPRTDEQLYTQLMVDPHSPAKYRVWGTIQNYPAFRTAYNCPANSKYAPESHCKVWVKNNSQ